MTVALIDYGMGNLRSVEKALEHVGLGVARTSDPAMVRDAAAVILPGVGAFGDAMERLRELGLDSAVCDTIAADKPFLGICLGLQMLFTESEEGFADHHERPGATVAGLDIFAGRVRRLPDKGLKIPHMGWNVATPRQPHESDAPAGTTDDAPAWATEPAVPGASALMSAITDATRFYFVHSYYVDPSDEDLIAATTDYGIEFTSAIARGNLFACQFHPEKSSGAGLSILDRFAAFAQRAAG